jgi:hypothetical protein
MYGSFNDAHGLSPLAVGISRCCSILPSGSEMLKLDFGRCEISMQLNMDDIWIMHGWPIAILHADDQSVRNDRPVSRQKEINACQNVCTRVDCSWSHSLGRHVQQNSRL